MATFFDRVKDTATTTGTGNFTLAGAAPTGYRTFASAFGSAATDVSYAIVLQNGSEWEVGYGTLSSSTTLARTTVMASSNSGSEVNFSAGTKDVFCTVIGGAAVIPTEYWTCLLSNYALTSTTSLQKLFNASTNGAVTIPQGRYFFEMMLYITSMSGTSGNGQLDILGAGTAVVTTGGLSQSVGVDNSTPTGALALSGLISQNVTAGAPVVTAGTGTAIAVSLRGTFRCQTAGTIIPSIALTTAAAGSVRAGSYFWCRRVGANGDTTGGPWS